MSTVLFQIYAETIKREMIIEKIGDWLRRRHQKEIVQSKREDFDFEIFEESTPTKFGVSLLESGWVLIVHNSFNYMEDLANELSNNISGFVINTIGHSNVNTFFMSIHKQGKLVRKIHYGEDSGGVVLEGTEFPFEAYIPQKVVGEEIMEPFFCFDFEDIIGYCSHFGLDIAETPFEVSGWDVLEVK